MVRLHLHSVASVGTRYFFNSFSSNVFKLIIINLSYNNYLGCLDIFLIINFLYAVFKVHSFEPFGSNGDNEIRTRDLLLARQALSQLSYTPVGSI